MHSVATSAAHGSDVHMLPGLLHGEERKVWGDGGYQGQTAAELTNYMLVGGCDESAGPAFLLPDVNGDCLSSPLGSHAATCSCMRASEGRYRPSSIWGPQVSASRPGPL